MGKINFELKEIKVSFYCTKCEKDQEAAIRAGDFYSHESACEMCGSHGEIKITQVKCPGCNYTRDIEIESW